MIPILTRLAFKARNLCRILYWKLCSLVSIVNLGGSWWPLTGWTWLTQFRQIFGALTFVWFLIKFLEGSIVKLNNAEITATCSHHPCRFWFGFLRGRVCFLSFYGLPLLLNSLRQFSRLELIRITSNTTRERLHVLMYLWSISPFFCPNDSWVFPCQPWKHGSLERNWFQSRLISTTELRASFCFCYMYIHSVEQNCLWNTWSIHHRCLWWLLLPMF